MRYIPHSPDDIRFMLEKIGVTSVDELFEQIPPELRFKGTLNLPSPMSEPEIMRHLEGLCCKTPMAQASFLGAGIYAHHLPPAADQLLLRSEFYTAYTPYQPEISQGTLQSIFEFQSMVCRIFGTGISNASMYDGATALVEAALMARRFTGKNRVLVSRGIHPEYIETLITYLNALENDQPDMQIIELDPVTGQTDLDALRAAITADTACMLVGYPNFVGAVEPLDQIVKIANESQVPVITSTTDVVALGILEAPGVLGASICTGEGQSIAVPPSFGGPGVGLFTIRDDKKLLRQMPGRLVGKTVDVHGNPGFVLTLSTREQHIRREKATSNICTNHGLIALAAAINLSLLGKEGFAQMAGICLSRAQYLKDAISRIPGLKIQYSGPTFHEFAVHSETRNVDDILAALNSRGICAGVSLERFHAGWKNSFLVTVTELNPKTQLDSLISELTAIMTAE